MSIELLDLITKTRRCLHPGCQSPLTEAELGGNEAGLLVIVSCGAGHESHFFYAYDATKSKAVLKTSTAVKTKLSGVSFQNPDGVERQSLLQYVQPGDDLEIVQGEVNGHPALVARHKLGVVGYIKRASIGQLLVGDDTIPLKARVIQITGGNADKPTRGCNIEVWRDDDGQRVYMDPDGRNIYHTDPHCSGLKEPTVVTKKYAEEYLHARPCKRCNEDK